MIHTRSERPYWSSILARKSASVVLSAVLPAITSYANGKPSGVTTRAITTCTQSRRLSRLWPNWRLSSNGGSLSKIGAGQIVDPKGTLQFDRLIARPARKRVLS